MTVKKALIRVCADDERMRVAGTARGEPRELRLEPVVERVILDLDVDAEPPRHGAEALERLHVLPQAVVGNSIDQQDRAAEQRRRVAARAVRDAEHETERARRVARNQHGRDLDAAERDRLAVGDDDVAARRRQARRSRARPARRPAAGPDSR